jgi:hypothetical protein
MKLIMELKWKTQEENTFERVSPLKKLMTKIYFISDNSCLSFTWNGIDQLTAMTAGGVDEQFYLQED